MSASGLPVGAPSATADDGDAPPADTTLVLLRQHWSFLRDRGVADDVAAERGYRSAIRKSELERLGFGRTQQLVPALVIPVCSVRREIESYQIRPDKPRLNEKGKARKYEMKSGSRMLLDFHPSLTRPREGGNVPLIADPTVPLFVTEGIPKGDAAVSLGLCCCALLGVFNFRGTNESGGKTALADWESIALNGRTILIAFDSDAMVKREVHAALARLKTFLESRHAAVKVIYLPVGEHGEKMGLDDFIAREKAAGKSDADIRDGLLALATEELRQPVPPPSELTGGDGADSELRGAITAIMLSKETKDFIKRRQVAGLAHRCFERDGFFCRTADDRMFYFSKMERRLYDLEGSAFEYLTSSKTGLGKTESVYGFTLHHLKTAAARTKALDVHTSAYFDPGTGLLAVSDAATGVWIRERNGEWILSHNGDNGLLFLTEPDAEAFDPDFKADGGNLPWFLNQFLLARHDPLTEEDQRTLLLINWLHGFFPALRRTRPIPCFLGPQGSGKTSGVKLLGRLLVGVRFEVTGLRKEREDAFIAAVCNRVVVGFDNADSRIPWLEDALAVYATGQRYRLRRLYTTNDEVAYDPRASILITSRDPHFNRSDVAERLLPFHFERPSKYRPEPTIFAELDGRRSAIWGELFSHLAAIADCIGERQAPPLAFRMADFGAFGWSLFALKEKTRDWIALLAKLERAQAGFAAENDGLVEALRIMLQREDQIGPITTGDLFKKLLEIVEAERLAFPETAQGFGRRLTATRRTIELELRCRFSEETGHRGQRWITLSPRLSGNDGAIGDDDPQTSTESGNRQ